MIVTNVDSKKGTVDVSFVLLSSNDTTQDANFDLTAKAPIPTLNSTLPFSQMTLEQSICTLNQIV